MSHTIKSLTKVLLICWSWLALAIAICLLSALLPFYPEGETQSTWFQRSGSFLVVITVWVQFILSKVQVYFEKDVYQVPIEIPGLMSVIHTVTLAVNIFGMLIGTALGVR